MSLENKGRIRILRGNASDENVKTVSLYAGQPFYDTSSKHLYIGDGTNTIENTAPIIADANNIIFYCETAGDVSKKTIELPGYKLIDGQKAFIMFKENNSAQSPTTLSINKNESKNIYFNGKSLTKITDLTGYSIKFKNTGFTESFKLNFYYKSSYYTILTSSVIDDLNEVVTIVGGEHVKNEDIIGFINNPDNSTFYPTNNIMANILYQLEYNNDAFYINDLTITNSTNATNAKYTIVISPETPNSPISYTGLFILKSILYIGDFKTLGQLKCVPQVKKINVENIENGLNSFDINIIDENEIYELYLKSNQQNYYIKINIPKNQDKTVVYTGLGEGSFSYSGVLHSSYFTITSTIDSKKEKNCNITVNEYILNTATEYPSSSLKIYGIKRCLE